MAIPDQITLYKLNDQFLEFGPLTNGLDDSLLTEATVTATLYDRSGEVIPEIDGLAFAHIGGGVYQAQVEDTFDPPKGGGYITKLDVNQAGLKSHFEIKTVVKIRTS